MAEEDILPHDLIRFEIEHCGTPVSTFPELRDEYAVLEVDDEWLRFKGSVITVNG